MDDKCCQPDIRYRVYTFKGEVEIVGTGYDIKEPGILVVYHDEIQTLFNPSIWVHMDIEVLPKKQGATRDTADECTDDLEEGGVI